MHTHNNKMIMLEPESSEVFESLGGSIDVFRVFNNFDWQTT